jgi:O-antigen ligase/polysaccharide polymerase Wzy-like membrane protein
VSSPGAAIPATARAGARRTAPGERALWIFLGLAIPVLVIAAQTQHGANLLLGACAAGLVVVSYQRVLLAWQTMLGAILVVILFIPIRRYTVAGGLPIELEPYRLVIFLVFACWFAALAVDHTVRWRRTGFEAPIAAVVLSILFSLVANMSRADAAGALVAKNVSFFFSYLLMIYFVVSVVRSRRDLDRMIGLLVGGGTIVGLASLIEWRTGSNLFDWYGRVIPVLHYVDEGVAQARGAGVRARGSAQHPIALSAALVMLIPLAFYLFQRTRWKVWLGCGAVLTLGALSTGSRTGTTMLIALIASFLCVRPRDSVRLLPWLLPMVIVIQGVMPGTLGTMKSMLNPNYVIKEQSFDNGGGGTGRIADLGPALDRWQRHVFLGEGFGTKVADPNAKAGSDTQILDDQWLGSLLEVGALGALALLWLFIRAIRRLNAVARSAPGPDGWLAMSLSAALTSFAVGMLTFDAFAFIQVTFFMFIVLGFAGVVTTNYGRAALRPVRDVSLEPVAVAA